MTLREKYRTGLKPLVVEEWVDLIIYRPLGFLLALPLARTPVTPNFVTFLSAVAGVVGAVFMALGKFDWLVWGAILYMVSNVLDCTDGQLARMTQKFSRYGRIYDGVADYVVGLTTFIGIGIGWRPEGMSNQNWWLLVFFGGIVATTYQVMHLNHVRQAYLKAVEHTDGSAHAHKGTKKRKSKKRKIFAIPFYLLYRLYLSVERSVRRQVHLPLELPAEIRNMPSLRAVLILWTFTGKGTHVTLLGFFLLFSEPVNYFWFCLIPGNIWIFAVWLGHRSVLRSIARKQESIPHESIDPRRRSVSSDGRADTKFAQDTATGGESSNLELDAERSPGERHP